MPGLPACLPVAVEAGGLLRGFEMVEFATSFFLRPARRLFIEPARGES